MATFISIDDLIRKAVASGTDKFPVSATQYLDVDAITAFAIQSLGVSGQGGDFKLVLNQQGQWVDEFYPSILNFDTAYIPSGSEPVGGTYYDAASKTLVTVLENGVILQHGQAVHIYGKNLSGSIISNGQPVATTDANGAFTGFSTVNITTDAALNYVGLATHQIAINGFGFVTIAGVVRDINTLLLDEGKKCYVSGTGGVTKTKPLPPNYVIDIGVVEYANATTGRINVQSNIIPKLEDLSDVDGSVTTISDTASLLHKDAADNVWKKITYANFKVAQKAYTDTLYSSKAASDKLSPQYAYYNRVLADLGTIKDLEELTKLYLNDLELDKSTLFKWSGWSGVKTRTSGSNVFVTKAYDNSVNNNDAVQATEANQPFYAGNIAPNEVGKIKNLIANKVLAHSTINVSSVGASGFSVTTVLKSNFATVGTSSNKGKYTSGTLEFFVANSGVIQLYAAGTGTVNISNTLFDARKFGTIIVTWAADASGLYCWINGVRYTYTGTYTAFSANLSGLLYSGADDTLAGEIYHHQIFNKALSAYEIQQHHAYLRSIYPEIEGVAIGNQFIATSNYEGVVAGDGSVIGEYQYTAANSPEIITNAADRDFSSDTGFWIKTAQVIIGGGVANIKSTDGSIQSITKIGIMPTSRWMKIKYDIIRNGGGSLTIDAATSTNIDSAVGVNKVAYIYSSTGTLSIKRNGITDIDIDNVSVKEVGWDEAQAVYDYVYAQTTGTAAVKDLAATKAASFWSYPNNLATDGAIHGKQYNAFGKDMIYRYAPKGYMIPSLAQWQQLGTYLSTSSNKMKIGGTTYWNDAVGTNESGLTLLGSGYRNTDGTFGALKADVWYWTSDNYLVKITSATGTITYTDASAAKATGAYIRLLRSEAVKPNMYTEDTSEFDTDISSTAKQIPISFNFTPSSVVINSTVTLTNVEARLFDSAGVELVSLFTAQTVDANVPFVFNVNANHKSLLVDGTVRVKATGIGVKRIRCMYKKMFMQ